MWPIPEGQSSQATISQRTKPLLPISEGKEDSGANSGTDWVATEITLFTKPDGVLSKRIALGEDGRPRPDGSAAG